ncbi:glycosyltransferase 6-like [Coffea eugenioides]|uniref:glycosyltransferase 6-like n=1 Tax=Coffea eugenioides TaxID=49369 RepID=UPI000F60DD66|nr:glycosyltransferase 6-like [Coffea eugenioides]
MHHTLYHNQLGSGSRKEDTQTLPLRKEKVVAMSKTKLHSRPPSLSRDKSVFIAAAITVLLVCVIWSFTGTFSNFPTLFSSDCSGSPAQFFNRADDPQETTFYDDPEISYTVDGNPIKNWDEKRKEWLKLHPTFAAGVQNRMLLLTGSQPSPCKNPSGDHLLLRCFKNKVDYCRIHGCDVFYNNAYLNPKMKSYWAKIPLIRASMLAHPEAEWIWWMDSDAIFTDMDFKVPLRRYKHHNFVVHGWPNLIYEKKSWVAVNAGIFLIRNCQWSMEFLDAWARMGPQSPEYARWGQTLRSAFKDKMFPESDDQSALVYLLLKEKRKWGDMMYVENEYSLHGYWVAVVGRIDNITGRYEKIEKQEVKLRRRHAEAVGEWYGKLWEEHLEDAGDRKGGWRRPFITHFTGCQPCSGDHNPSYVGKDCWVGMERALNFADNQVLRNFGFVHPDLRNGSVSPLAFDFPGAEASEDSLA